MNDNEVNAFLAEMRATYVSEPEEAVASRHLAAIAHESGVVLGRQTPNSSRRRTMIRNRFLRPVATLGAATLAAILATAGLAVAGVNLPEPAQNAFTKAGITLPNQAGGGQSGEHSRSDAVHSVIEATPPSERGCAFGHSVAEAAKGSSLPAQAQGACDKGDEEHGAATNSSSSHSQFGRDTAERAKGQKDATVEQRKSFGRQTSDQAKQLGSSQSGNAGAKQRSQTPAADDTTDGTTTGPPQGTPGPPDNAGAPDGTPGGAPDGTPSGRP